MSKVKCSNFSELQSDQLVKVPADNLNKDWFAVPVTHGSGMFNPVFLPFKYISQSGINDPKETLTFPSLLSYKFEFVPDNFSARSPDFIFRRDPKVLTINPDNHRQIKAYINDWSATHAISGELIQTSNGFCGRMNVFDRNGIHILQKSYSRPVSYFTLMGMMVRDWMEYSGQKVSPDLYAELIRPMTSKPETLKLYGSSFDVPWRTEAEWRIYEKILHDDPNFGEVRYWYANQKGWKTGNFNDEEQISQGKSLLDHLIISALWEFNANNCKDPVLVRNFGQKLDHALKIAPYNPNILKVCLAQNNMNLTPQQVDSMLPLAQSYPCNYEFLNKLADYYRNHNICENSIPLNLSATYSGFLTGNGNYEGALWPLGNDFGALGYLNESYTCNLNGYRHCDEDWRSSFLGNLALDYQESFNFREAAELLKKSYIQEPQTWKFFYAIESLCQGGYLDTANDWLNDPTFGKDTSCGRTIVSLYQALDQKNYDGAFANIHFCESQFKRFKDTNQLQEWVADEFAVMRADTYLLAKASGYQKAVFEAWLRMPRSRRTGKLVELAIRDNPQMLCHFAEVAAFTFPGQSFWQKMLQNAKMHSTHDSTEELIQSYRQLEQKYSQVPINQKLDFWSQQPPFSVEYLCLSLVQTRQPKLQQEGLRLYTDYAKGIQSVSEKQKEHVGIFLHQLETLMRR